MASVIRKLIDATLIIDNIVIGYVPNSLSYTEGLGEQKIRTQTSGGGNTQQIVTEDVSKKMSVVKFHVEPTADNLAMLRAIKADLNGHVVTISTTGFTRTIVGATLTNDYEVKFGMDDVVNVEFHGKASI